jgi:predicted N-acetyltransferase YhbS
MDFAVEINQYLIGRAAERDIGRVSFIRLRADTPHLSALAHAHFTEWGHLSPTVSEERMYGRLARMCAAENFPIVIGAVAEGRLVGSAMLSSRDALSPESCRKPWLTGLYVVPDRRREGIARSLVVVIEQLALARGFRSTYLDCVLGLEPFYARLGYRRVDLRSYQNLPLALMHHSF